MDKNAIKKFAIWAREELIARVSQKAEQYAVTEKDAGDPNVDTVYGRLLLPQERMRRAALIARVRKNGWSHTMEEVAYTWFNRFCALRYMEINGFLPTHVRVFTDEAGAFKPQILAEAIHLELDGLDMDKVYQLKDANETETLYKYLLLTQCNALKSTLGLFRPVDHSCETEESDYTALLLPDNLLHDGSVIEQMVLSIDESDWADQVQIIGWLYQYYNAVPKDVVFANLKKNIKISKNDIPAATQLFTPDWIVRYMVENSLGRLWEEGHPDDALKADWKYYLEEAPQTPEVQARLAEIRKGHQAIKPEDIRVIDPCMGSGHILVYLFDVLMQIYTAYGYPTRDAVRSILENNLYGLDIDDRAAQLAEFAVLMKALSYDRRFLTRKLADGKPDLPQPRVSAILESGDLDSHVVDYFVNGDANRRSAMDTLTAELTDAKEYGSILTVTNVDFAALYARFDEITDDVSIFRERALQTLLPFVRVAQALAQQYDVVVTNPPYMGSSGMDATLAEHVKKRYPDTKSDMSTVCMERALTMCKPDGYMAMINIPVWMFLSSYEKLRHTMIQNNTFVNMVHPGRGIFGSDFGTTTFVIGKRHIAQYKGNYCRLFDKQGEVETIEVREQRFFEGRGRYTAQQDNFEKIPGAPVAYWVSERLMKAFESGIFIGDKSEPRVGMATANNDRFIRLWHEVKTQRIGFGCSCRKDAKESKKRWFPFAKGGENRKWYGNNEYVVNWENDGFEIQNFTDTETGRIRSHNYNLDYIFQSAITWTVISSASTSFRYEPIGFLYSNSGYGMFVDDETLKMTLLGLMNTKVVEAVLLVLSPTIGFESGYLRKIPFVYNPSTDSIISEKVKSSISLSRTDWDSFETSWDFQRHPLVANSDQLIANSYTAWEQECADRVTQLKANEEELNRIFIGIYGLQDELTPEVADKDVTVRRADLARDIRSLISYAVGCMMGRYSLDRAGLQYGGGDWEANRSQLIANSSYPADKDGILPICDDEYFDDDIVGLFVKFVETVYGADTLEQNLRYIADALGGAGSPREVIRAYFLNDFYADHLKIYQKRPIYWLFDSGKKNGFKCLIYMHRYRPDTVARIRTDYVHEQQSRYRTAIADLENRVAAASTAERVKLTKQLGKLQEQAEDLRVFEEKIHHLADQMIPIDLDDGVKHNYAIFEDVLSRIK